jgi:hypothetical protein
MEPESSLHRSLLLDPNLGHMNLVHIFKPYFCEIHFNIIFPSAWDISDKCKENGDPGTMFHAPTPKVSSASHHHWQPIIERVRNPRN